MCDFCVGKEKIERTPNILENKHVGISLRIDEETKIFKARLEFGSIGYTLPIKANFCMFCGDKITQN